MVNPLASIPLLDSNRARELQQKLFDLDSKHKQRQTLEQLVQSDYHEPETFIGTGRDSYVVENTEGRLWRIPREERMGKNQIALLSVICLLAHLCKISPEKTYLPEKIFSATDLAKALAVAAQDNDSNLKDHVSELHAFDRDTGIMEISRLPGKTLAEIITKGTPAQVEAITNDQINEMLTNLNKLIKLDMNIDLRPVNLLYDKKAGFGLIDFGYRKPPEGLQPEFYISVHSLLGEIELMTLEAGAGMRGCLNSLHQRILAAFEELYPIFCLEER